jgi:hypothetical protein
MSLTSANGQVDKIEFKVGDIRWMPAGEQLTTGNLTSHPIQIVEIELKNHPKPFTPSALDPLNTAAKFYQLELETEQLRVLRIRMGAHEKGTRHEHR